MLLPAQVIPFLSHDDEFLRDQATGYFSRVHDPAPLTAEDVWEAIDKLPDSAGFARHVALLPLVPASDASTARLLAAIGDDRLLDAEEDLWDALHELDFDQLRRHADAIFARADLPDDVRAHLRARLDLAGVPHDELWNRLLRHLAENREKYWNELSGDDLPTQLVEAIARHGDAAASRATAIVGGGTNAEAYDDARDLFAIQVLARLRHRPAIDLLVQKFLDADEEDDVLFEELMYGIPKVGGPDAVAPLERAFADGGEGYRIYASGALGRISHPDAEAALVRLIENPSYRDVRDHSLIALGGLLPTDGLSTLKRFVLSGEYDTQLADLREDLVATALMSGVDFPELGAVREEVIARHVELERRLEVMERSGGLDGDWDDMPDTADLLDEYDPATLPALPPEVDDQYPPVTAPIRHAEAKVGRNDPCPCGSGKKYKKCCLGK